MNALLQDLRYALRQLRRSPGFTTVIILTLALGIGANTAIFSVVHGVLLNPLHYEEPGRLVVVGEVNLKTGGDPFDVSYANFADWKRETSSFEELAAFGSRTVTLTGGDEPSRLRSATVTPALFRLLGVRPELGRVLADAEEVDGRGERVVLLSHRIWQSFFGSDTSVAGRTVTLNGEPHTVIGVMPAGFAFPSEEIELWTPLDLPEGWRRNRAVHVLTVIGRLRSGVTLERAAAEMRAVAARIQEKIGESDPEHSATLTPLHELVTGDVRPALLTLMGAVLFVPLIGCTNVSKLMPVRAGIRGREIAVPAALGASRLRVARLLLTERLLLAVLGGLAGVVVGIWGVDLLVAGLPDNVPRTAEIGVSLAVLLFAATLTLITGLAFGLLPAIRTSKPQLAGSLREAGLHQGPLRSRLRAALTVSQIAVSLVLLAGAGLFLRSFWRVLQEDPGFRAEGVLTMSVSLIGSTFDETEEVIGFYRQLRERLESLPSVEAASGVNYLPISGGDPSGQLTIEGRPFPRGETPSASFRRILPGYFRTMGVPIVQGRDFNARDSGAKPFVVIVNETMALRHFPNGDAVGSRIKVGPGEEEPWLTVVGVVGDVRNIGLEAKPRLATYEPHPQRPWSTMNLVVRTSGDPLSTVAAVRREIQELGGELPVYNISSMGQRISASVAPLRFVSTLLGAFAATALLLAAIGLYGVISYSIEHRARELGIRLVLGATRGDIVALVLGNGMALTVAGIVLGLSFSLALTRFVGSLLYEVSPTDAATLAFTSVLLAVVGVLSCYFPARRAARVEPMLMLRDE